MLEICLNSMLAWVLACSSGVSDWRHPSHDDGAGGPAVWRLTQLKPGAAFSLRFRVIFWQHRDAPDLSDWNHGSDDGCPTRRRAAGPADRPPGPGFKLLLPVGHWHAKLAMKGWLTGNASGRLTWNLNVVPTQLQLRDTGSLLWHWQWCYVRVWPGQAHWQCQRAARCQAPRQTRTDSEVPLAAKALLPSYVQPAIQVQCLRLPRLGLQSLRPWLTIMIDNFLPIMIFRRFSLWAASVCQCQMLLSTSKFLFLLKDMMRFKCRDRDKWPSGWSGPFRVLPSLRSAWAARARQSFKFQVPSEPGAPDSEAVDRDQGGLQVPGFTATVSDSEHTEGTVGGFESESGWQTPGDCNTSGTLESQPDIWDLVWDSPHGMRILANLKIWPS